MSTEGINCQSSADHRRYRVGVVLGVAEMVGNLEIVLAVQHVILGAARLPDSIHQLQLLYITTCCYMDSPELIATVSYAILSCLGAINNERSAQPIMNMSLLQCASPVTKKHTRKANSLRRSALH